MPDNKPPAFMFYAGDFLSNIDVAFMDMELRGVYITLLAYSWLEYGLPDDDEKLAKLVQCRDKETWNSYKRQVLQACFVLEDGVWRQPRQERERKRADKRSEQQSLGGKKGAEKRWKKEKRISSRANKNGSAMASEIEIEFENEFWKLYPRNVRKKDAKKKYLQARNLVDKDVIINSLNEHLKGAWAEKEVKFIPHASTWLNAEGWEDDASKPDGTTGKAPKKLINKVCPVCGYVKQNCSPDSYDVCRKHEPSMKMEDESKKLLNDVLIQANAIREELGLPLVGEK
tara:strand:+ start:9493 stop:10350 length:858 start_codon:yes stop_codon:yes gene_type:complete